MDDLDILTLAEASELLGRSPTTLRHQVAAGRLRARLIGKTWITTRAEVERYRGESLGQPGRPARTIFDKPKAGRTIFDKPEAGRTIFDKPEAGRTIFDKPKKG